MYQIHELTPEHLTRSIKYCSNLSRAEEYMDTFRANNIPYILKIDGKEVKRYTPQDRCSQIIENLKFFMYDSEDDLIVKNEFGFEHDTKFVSWVGDGHSFIITDGKDEYRIQISKEEM